MNDNPAQSAPDPDLQRPIDQDHVENVCKIGQGPATCRYLTMGRGGFSCEKHSELAMTIDAKVLNGQFTARGDNCAGRLCVSSVYIAPQRERLEGE